VNSAHTNTIFVHKGHSFVLCIISSYPICTNLQTHERLPFLNAEYTVLVGKLIGKQHESLEMGCDNVKRMDIEHITISGNEPELKFVFSGLLHHVV
jgi:hypothetical protein